MLVRVHAHVCVYVHLYACLSIHTHVYVCMLLGSPEFHKHCTCPHDTNLQGGKIALWGLGVASDLTRDLGIGVASELTRIWGFGMASKLTQDLVEVTHKLIHLLYYSLGKT